MATVYRATRLLIGDTVAVKILHPEQLRDPQAPERFRREAQAAARLKHQNAVTIYDFGISDGGIVYLVMELVEGQSLRWLIKEQGPLVPSAASEIMTQVCAALDEAHTQKVVHRDIKPDNIIVATSASGLRVKVLDFGIARLRDMSGFGNLTQTGSVMGTPQYMSPEQCLGEELDGRSDIYSLGVVLYEMLAGVVPFNSPTSMAVVVQHVNSAPPPLRVLNVSISPAVEAVVMRALEKRRDARPQSANALAAELAAALGGAMPAAASLTTTHAVPDSGSMPTIQMATPWPSAAVSPGQVSPTPAPAARRGSDVAKKVSPWLLASVGVLAMGILAGVAWWVMSSGKRVAEVATEQPLAPPASPNYQPPTSSTSAAPPEPSLRADSAATPTTVAPRSTDSSTGNSRGATQTAPRPSSAPAAPTGPATLSGGGLTVRSQSGSTVLIDGSVVGTTNNEGILSIARVATGRHLLTVRRDGFRQEDRTITFGGQNDVAEVALTTLPAQMNITANTPGATFQVDGEGRSYTGQISSLELPPGHHSVTATKTGFKPATMEVELRPGDVIRSTITLDALSADEILAEANRNFQAGEFEKAASGARLLLTTNPQQPKANLMLGRASYRQKKFSDSFTFFSKAIDLGEEVEIPVIHHHGAFAYPCAGIVTLSKSRFAFRSTSSFGHDFSVPPGKILEIKNEPEKAKRVNVNVTVPNGKKEETKDYNFQNTAAARIPNPDGSKGLVFQCPGCDDSMNVLYDLLDKLRRQ
jgi:serine/threonine protein kinase